MLIVCKCGRRYGVSGGVSFACRICGRRLGETSPAPSASAGLAAQPQPPTCEGPGTELKALLASLGLTPASGCDCNARAAQMNAWGVDGCREHRDEIIAWLQEQKDKAGWLVAAQVGLKVFSEPWFKMSDPLGSMVDEAIRRAGNLPT